MKELPVISARGLVDEGTAPFPALFLNAAVGIFLVQHFLFCPE
jgi:hypothetical protein